MTIFTRENCVQSECYYYVAMFNDTQSQSEEVLQEICGLDETCILTTLRVQSTVS